MKTKLLLFFLSLAATLSGQDLLMNFNNISYLPIDSITAINLRTGDDITIGGNETLILGASTGIELNNYTELQTMVYPNPCNGRASVIIKSPRNEDKKPYGRYISKSISHGRP